MLSRAIIIAAIVAIAEARYATVDMASTIFKLIRNSFGQEQIPIPAIAAVTSGGAPGQAATIAGAAISDLLAGANACAKVYLNVTKRINSMLTESKLQRADQIIAELGTGADAVAAAIGMVIAEKNFNPFAQSIPTICDDPTLPATERLRGITPLIDPAVGGSDVTNALSASSAKAPLDATGKSIADLLTENGFSNFTGQAAAGNTTTTGNANAATPSAAAGKSLNHSYPRILICSSSSMWRCSRSQLSGCSSSCSQLHSTRHRIQRHRLHRQRPAIHYHGPRLRSLRPHHQIRRRARRPSRDRVHLPNDRPSRCPGTARSAQPQHHHQPHVRPAYERVRGEPRRQDRMRGRQSADQRSGNAG